MKKTSQDTRRKALFLTVLSLLFVGSFSFVSAQIDFAPLDNRGIEGFTDKATASDLSELLNTIYQVMISVASVLAVIMIFYAGFSYAVSSNSDARSRAKNRIISALGGLALALSSWLILSTIDEDLVESDVIFQGFKEGHLEFSIVTEDGRQYAQDIYGTKYEIIDNPDVENVGVNVDVTAGQQTSCGQYAGPNAIASNVLEDLRRNVFPQIAQGGFSSNPRIVKAYKDGTTYSNSARASTLQGVITHGNIIGVNAESTASYGQRTDPNRGGKFGYHFVISRGGTILQAAPLDKRTNHATGLNSTHIGISFAQTLVSKKRGDCPAGVYLGTDQQFKALASLMVYLKRELGGVHNITGSARGHGEVSNNRQKGEGLDAAVFLREFIFPRI